MRPARCWVTALLLFMAMGSAMAKSPCARPTEPWGCPGRIVVKVETPKGTAELRLINFDNAEMLAEIEKDGVNKRHLQVRPSGVQLFIGLAATETAAAGPNNPFMFFDMTFALPVGALAQAYPDGPASVPATAASLQLDIGGNQVGLTAQRSGREDVAFCLVAGDRSAPRMCGSWQGQTEPALPDNWPLDGWRSDGYASYATLGAARKPLIKP